MVETKKEGFVVLALAWTKVDTRKDAWNRNYGRPRAKERLIRGFNPKPILVAVDGNIGDDFGYDASSRVTRSVFLS